MGYELPRNTLRPRDFPLVPVVKTLLPPHRTQVRSLVQDLRSHIPAPHHPHQKNPAQFEIPLSSHTTIPAATYSLWSETPEERKKSRSVVSDSLQPHGL